MDLKKTAVVMIEYQSDFMKPGGAQHESVRGVMESTDMVANSLKFAEESRRSGASIMLTPITFARLRWEQQPSSGPNRAAEPHSSQWARGPRLTSHIHHEH